MLRLTEGIIISKFTPFIKEMSMRRAWDDVGIFILLNNYSGCSVGNDHPQALPSFFP